MSQRTASNRLLVAKSTLAKVPAWFCLALSAWLSVTSLRAGDGNTALLYLIFGAIGVFILMVVGSVQMNQESIFYRSVWAHYAMRWDEVERVEVDARGGVIVFAGGNKRLAAMGPNSWLGADGPEMRALLASKVESRAIPVKRTQSALFRLSKNTKVY